MTDAADHTDLAAPDSPEEPPTLASQLLALQRVDTEIDQLTVRRARLPERDNLATRTEQMNDWEARRVALNARIDELTELIESEEATGAELTAERARLQGQMKTVIAPREAEALMHEIETIDGRRDELDDQELAALEEQATLDDDLTAHLGQEEALRAALGHADEALAAACADIDAELGQLAERRTDALEPLEPAVVARYESVRSSVGVAIAELKGSRCDGCHLDLSAAEVDTAKEEAAEAGFTDCPQCGRMLVV